MRFSFLQGFNRGVEGILRIQQQTFETQNQIASGRRILTPADDPVALGALISESMANVGILDAKRQEVCQFARENYSFESMSQSFLKAIEFTVGADLSQTEKRGNLDG